ncbi:MAG TPA: kelch repeat-containing protein [Dehalococcoidia bacterium]|nr:kelch repeat-containing protein [Dehalococcoidia bacterium]
MIPQHDTRISRRAMLRAMLAASAGAGAVALVGCGGSDGGEPTPALTPAPARPSPTPAPVRATWAPVAASGGPGPRGDHSVTYHASDGLLYVFGGRRGGVATDELWTFDPRSAAWTKLEPAGERPQARFGHNAVYDAAGQRLVVALGQNGSEFYNDVWAYGAGSWTRLGGGGDAPAVRYGAGAALDPASRRLLISHGFTDRGRFDDTWGFGLGPAGWSQLDVSGGRPVKRCLTRCAWAGDTRQLLLFGGQTDGTPFLGDFWVLDADAGRWSEQRPEVLPGPRNLYAAALDPAGARWYVVSGNTPDGPTDETWAYDIASGGWARVEAQGSLPARYSADAAFASEALYLFGGHDGQGELNDLWALRLSA